VSTATASSTATPPDGATIDDTPTVEQRLETGPGTIAIADAVVAKVAAQAALDVPEAGAAAARMLGAMPGASRLGIRQSSLSTRPQVSVDIDGSDAYIDLSISVRWPASVPKVTAQVRDRVIASVHELTGLTVSQVRITVTALITDTPPARVQ
jgi:uncharacterized alkaline shock family protein YloU